MTSRINMLRCATSHDFDTVKLILIRKRVPVPKDKSPQTDVLNNILFSLCSEFDV